jgi:hypothetical protein
MLKIKPGVKPPILIMAAACANVAQELGTTVTITAGTDGRHMEGSRHYTSEALDIRSTSFKTRAAKDRFIAAVLSRLGPGFEMFLESPGRANEHFHLEVQA